MYDKVFILTDGCMWEINKETGNEHPHAIEVVDERTGAVRYIKSGSRIKFLGGEITDLRAQKNNKKVSGNGQTLPNRKERKAQGGKK